ncbi:hypothetical protein J1N10_14745 [Carboxylicivirga sp. A043]|uniref:hypothetical protein n=1 Tax=Carboxylicivirga litoralis TaxID=2816963 RepID=UPI0021CAF2C7|nr:hypothetical protein [Carboxylicivirga sp. A043]MCU4157233.1 hypothetical protein [Carboxylicivirga sp. A043]
MTSKKALKQIKLIYFIICILLGVFAVASFIFVTLNGPVYIMDAAGQNNLKSLIIILALAGIPASYMFHNRKVKQINKEQQAHTKLQQFRTSYFIKIMTLEGVTLLSLLSYLMIGNINQMLVFGLVYLFLILNYPKQSSILSELEINKSEL